MLEQIGKKIRQAREDNNISQKDLGTSLGLSDKAVSAYESSRTIPPLETLTRIADELNKPINYFISDNSDDYSIETKLVSMEKDLSSMLTELREIHKSLKSSDLTQNPETTNNEEKPTAQPE
ncbi:MAG: helix-turn-helix transcriptional regulator [Patescibacteria group bacterium]|nr:helix-turn-helix transcriptional regulator [Patescibacteria group bacterium]